MAQEREKHLDIDGWGADLELKNRPAYPMWKRPAEGTGAHWLRPIPQELKFKEFHSIERPGMTSVFGTSVPPSGLSGVVRGIAFKYSEGSFAHWMTLILADRINVIEGVLDDLRHGHIPNLYAEMGARAEIKYNPRGVAKKLIFGAIIIGAVPFILKLKKGQSNPN